MTERDFDKIFQDKIGDELPFEFHHADWLAAEQELDKVMPISAPVAPRYASFDVAQMGSRSRRFAVGFAVVFDDRIAKCEARSSEFAPRKYDVESTSKRRK